MARLAGRLRDGSAVISATNGKTTTAAMVAAILEGTGARLVHNRAGANMAGGVTTALLGAARGVGDRRRRGPLRGRRVLARPGRAAAAPARAAAGEPLPRPARPLRRARDDRRPLGGGGRGRAGHAARAERRRPARRRPRARSRRRRDVLRRAGRRRRASRHGARVGLQALPALRRAVRLRRGLHGPPRPLPLPQRRRPAARAGRVGDRHRARRHARRELHAAHRRASALASPSPSPASTTSTTRSAPPRSRTSLGGDLERDRRRPGRRRRRRSGAPRPSSSAIASSRSCS